MTKILIVIACVLILIDLSLSGILSKLTDIHRNLEDFERAMRADWK